MTARLDGAARSDKGAARKYANANERDAARKAQKLAAQRRYRQANKAKLDAAHKAYRAENPEVARRAAVKHYWKHRARIFAKRFGVTEAEILALPNTCEICGSAERLCIDHCHDSGKVRGVLCNPCNLALGYMKDDAHRLHRAARYIQRSSTQET